MTNRDAPPANAPQVLRLPAAQLSAAEVRPLVAACLDRLQGDFGDLEAVAGQAATLQRFCALPFQVGGPRGAAAHCTSSLSAECWQPVARRRGPGPPSCIPGCPPL